jgi:hypothetical protein
VLASPLIDAGRYSRPPLSRRLRFVPAVAIAAVLVGVFSTWTTVGPVTLNGTQGPNNGWLVVVLTAPALAWARMMERSSWIGVVGVLGASIVMCWTAIENWADNRDVLDASVGHGLVLVVGASVILAAVAVLRGVELARSARERESR